MNAPTGTQSDCRHCGLAIELEDHGAHEEWTDYGGSIYCHTTALPHEPTPVDPPIDHDQLALLPE